MKLAAILVLAVVAAAVGLPQQDGQRFSDEAIKQAQSTLLIPKDAQIQGVQEGIELAAYDSIPGSQKVNLFEVLGGELPANTILQGQIERN